jgi:hypothetical protein
VLVLRWRQGQGVRLRKFLGNKVLGNPSSEGLALALALTLALADGISGAWLLRSWAWHKVLDRTNFAEINVADKAVSVQLPIQGSTGNLRIGIRMITIFRGTRRISHCRSGVRATITIVSKAGRSAGAGCGSGNAII